VCTPVYHLQNITDEDVLALVNDEVHQPTVVWVLEDLQASWRWLCCCWVWVLWVWVMRGTVLQAVWVLEDL